MVPMSGLLASAGAAEGDELSPEIAFLVFLNSLEQGMAALYATAIKTNRFDGDASTLAKAFQGHHTQHAKTLADLITAAGATVPEAGNAGLVAKNNAQIAGAADSAALVGIFKDLEDAMAATHLASLKDVTSDAITGAVGSILPIEAQHGLVWQATQDPAVLDDPAAQPLVLSDASQLQQSEFDVSAPTTTAAPTTTTQEGAQS